MRPETGPIHTSALVPEWASGGSISTVWIALFQHFQLRCTLLTGGSARKIRCEERRASMASCLSSASRSHSRVSRSTCSGDVARRPRDGAPSWVTTHRNCRHGPVRCSEHWLRPALCPSHRLAEPQRPCLDQCHNESDRGMDRTPDY